MRTVLKLVEKNSRTINVNINFLYNPTSIPSFKNVAFDDYLIKGVQGTKSKEYNLSSLSTNSEKFISLPVIEDFKIFTLFLYHVQKNSGSYSCEIPSMNKFISDLKGKKLGHSNYVYYKNRILESLNRWMHVTCTFKDSYFVSKNGKKPKHHLDLKVFSFIEGYEYSEKENLKTGRISKSLKVTFNKEFLDCHKEKYAIAVNLEHLLKMKSGIGLNLYQMLCSKRIAVASKAGFSISLKKITNLLGLDHVPKINQFSVIESKLNSAMKELYPILDVKHEFILGKNKCILFYQICD